MPIFEYVCKKCDHRFEAIVNASTQVECPSCASQRLEKQLSVFATLRGALFAIGDEELLEYHHGYARVFHPFYVP